MNKRNYYPDGTRRGWRVSTRAMNVNQKPTDEHTGGYRSLASDVILSAVIDYIDAYKRTPNIHDAFARSQCVELERFFKSEYFSTLNNGVIRLTPEQIIEQLRKRAQNG